MSELSAAQRAKIRRLSQPRELSPDEEGGELNIVPFLDIVVNILIFVLAFFLDFFELSFIVVPLIGPVAEKLGIDLVWFGVLLAVNMQTSFMHPPFGFALFYLRSVAPHDDYKDRVTGKTVSKVTTGQIYWGAVPFVLIQIIMVGLIIAFPNLVSGGLGKKADLDTTNIQIDVQPSDYKTNSDADNAKLFGTEPAASAPAAAASEPEKAEDPMEAVKRSLQSDTKK